MHAPTLPSEETTRDAREAVRALTEATRTGAPTLVEVVAEGGQARVTVPLDAFELLMDVLSHLANGHAVTVMPVKAELTTQQTADLLNVSRPFVVKLLEEGRIPFRKVGTHRRVRLEEVLAYKAADDLERRAAADALGAEAQELGLGY